VRRLQHRADHHLGAAHQRITAEQHGALREQLGLKLEPQTAPYEVLVIDQVTMPTPD